MHSLSHGYMTHVLPIFVPEDVAKAKALCTISQLIILGVTDYFPIFLRCCILVKNQQTLTS